MIDKLIEPKTDDNALPFSKRSPLVPWRYKTPVMVEDMEQYWSTNILGQAAVQTEVHSKRVAYFHIPFCANHCLFCGFYVNHFEDASASEYTDILINELALDAEKPNAQAHPIQAVYLGGGTPTALSRQNLYDLIVAIRKCLPLAKDCEITVEGRIFHFTDDKIQACLDAGANRFSIGVQSFDTQVRKKQGRKKSKEEAVSFLKNLTAQNQAAVVIDLMLGLPYQSFDIWKNDLETCVMLNPDGVDLYALNVYPTTPLYKAIQKGLIPEAAELQEQLDMYCYGADYLAEAGYMQISNSHWASNTRERNIYNLYVKDSAEVLAFGSGAGGNLNGISFTIQKDLEKYKALAREGKKPLGFLFQSDSKQKIRDFISANLEKGRLDKKKLFSEFSLSPDAKGKVSETIQFWKEKELIDKESNDVIWLSTAGRFWGPNLIADLTEIVAPADKSSSSEQDFMKHKLKQ